MLDGLFGKTVTLQAGETIAVDEAYIRESIVNPNEKITAGFQPIMPAYQGLVNEEQLLELIEYVQRARHRIVAAVGAARRRRPASG